MRFRIFLVVFFGLYSCAQPERNCKKFQTGSFEFSSISSNGLASDSVNVSDGSG